MPKYLTLAADPAEVESLESVIEDAAAGLRPMLARLAEQAIVAGSPAAAAPLVEETTLMLARELATTLHQCCIDSYLDGVADGKARRGTLQ